MNNIIISNTCVGQFLIKKKNIFPYNNPFIGSLIPNDLEYIKLINNISYYISQEPYLGIPNKDSIFSKQNNNIYYIHDSIQIPYPIIYLDDIELHFIHENDSNIALDKFKRRLNRFKELIKLEDYKIIITLSFSEFINNHEDYNIIINEYFKNNENNNLNIEKYFLGPSEYNNNNKNYIIVENWNNINLERDKSHVLLFNDQIFSINLLYDKINFL